MKLYGSLINRLQENQTFVDEIKVGDYATVYLWSDRHAYEVVEVKNQKHVFIRRLKAIRTDEYGMSESQEYRYESDETNLVKELQLTKWGWKEIHRYDRNLYNKIIKRDGFCRWDADIVQRVLENKEVKRSSKINISFGIANEYYDYSF